MHRRKLNWWLLYLVVPFMIGLLLFEGHLNIPPAVHQVLEIGIVVLSFGLMALWVNVNQGAILTEQLKKEHWRLEANTNSEPDLDPRHLPVADIKDHSDLETHQLNAGLGKGRFN